MRDWVEEFASLCDANSTDKKGCSEQQIKFIDKWSGKLIWRYILRHLLSDGFGWTLLASRNLFFRHARKPKDDLQGQLTRLKGSWAAEWDDLVTEIRNQTNQSASQPTNRAMRQPTNERINLSINALSDFILSDLILSYRILSYVILSYLILSYLILSYLIVSIYPIYQPFNQDSVPYCQNQSSQKHDLPESVNGGSETSRNHGVVTVRFQSF